MKKQRLLAELGQILNEILSRENWIDDHIKYVHQDYRLGAKNLYRYLMLRTHDLRPYHDALSDLGLSSLRTAESYVLSKLINVVRNLKMLNNQPIEDEDSFGELDVIGYKQSKKLLRKHANSLFNKERKNHFTEIMVTLPLEAAEDKSIIEEMVRSGMEIARINLSHGSLEQWQAMVDFIQEIREELGVSVKIYMDLSGPKIRTAKLEIVDEKGAVRDKLTIKKGEHIILTKRNWTIARPTYGSKGEQLTKPVIGVSLPQIIDDAQVGDSILFDDGMIRGKIVEKEKDTLEVLIKDCFKSKLGGMKGINLPDSKINLPALTEDDLANLPFVCLHADMVGYSFVRTGSDVLQFYEQLELHGAHDLGVIFKIENKEAFENLPEILLQGMRHNKVGVMIARGDLAIEVGFERISEVQSQILWLCEAAHIPVIWATQVLDNLARTGIPTRAEISDAAMGTHAECVMLNKGPYINEAIKVLKNIITRMEGHGFKKKNALRSLSLAKNYLDKSKEEFF